MNHDVTQTAITNKEGSSHTPVLLNEVLAALDPKPGEFMIDGTIDGGGHAHAILAKIGTEGVLMGVDWDYEMIERGKLIFKERENVTLVQGNYADLPEILKERKMERADGLLLDLGFSSTQLEYGDRGFSFQKNEILDMRYDQGRDEMAADVVNKKKEQELADIFYKYGEERASRKIAKAIIEARKKKPIITTNDLSEIVAKCVRKGKTHPATKVFQALRIYVNAELENLETVLKNIGEIVRPGGKIAIITFHSLEDRIVKNAFKELEKHKKAVILTKKPIQATRAEVKENPRSRSAKLRAITI